MSDGEPTWTIDHPEVVAAFEDYVQQLERGQTPSRTDLLERFPSLADELNDCLEGLEMIHRPKVVSDSQPIPIESTMPSELGEYRLIRELGRGGMGIVYEAEQRSLGRRVALKILPAAAMLDPRKLQRFRHEAQAAATLEHPNIVPVYGVGEENGIHFFSMQYIPGQTLADVVRKLRRRDESQAELAQPNTDADVTHVTAEASDNTMSLLSVSAYTNFDATFGQREYAEHVAKLGREAALALDHAHQAGVVHRDIKPANLMIDTQGKLWITDFGLAHLENDVELTRTGDLVGTLRYMSPEQALGKRGLVEQRTDIYSLAATLYELLALRPVIEGADQAEMLDRIANEDARPPRQWNRAIPVDLETILLKALAKNSADRYATAGDFAADLERFLNDQPIEAKRPSLAKRFAKWTRRHRRAVAVGVAMLVLVATGVALSLYSIGRERANTQQATQQGTQQRQLAEARFRKAQEMLAIFTEVIERDFPEDTEFHEVRRQLLEAALAYHREFLNEANPNPDVAKKLSDSQFRVASILDEMGERERARTSFHEAVELHQDLVRRHPHDAELRRSLEEKYQLWARLESGEVVQQLQRPTVQAELRLNAQQRSTAEALFQQYYASMFRDTLIGTGPWDERVEHFEAGRHDIATKLQQMLTPTQLARLHQIRLQARGPRAFTETAVQERLQLRQEQIKKFEKLVKVERRTPTDDTRFGRRPSRRQMDQEIQAILDTIQRKTWKTMLGRPFRDRG